MKFETYMLSNADCEYMRERIDYRQEGDCFFIGIVRDENNKGILYNSAEFPPQYSDLKEKLYLFCIRQYREPRVEKAKLQRESLAFVIPRRKYYPPVRMKWLDEVK